MHLTAACEEDASRAATLLTDAFRTASLPGADTGRSVVIRRLALGRIQIHVSPASLALHIERMASRVAAEAVAFDLPEARDATAVVFPDRARPIVALARLHARRAQTDAWFWPAVVPRWHSCQSSEDRWLLLLDTAHTLPEAAIVAAAIVNEAELAGVERELLAAIPAGRAAAWLRLAGWTTWDPTDSPTADRGSDDILPSVVARAIEEFGPLDDRVIWLSTMLAVHAAPSRAADATLPVRIARSLSRMYASDSATRFIVRRSRETPSGEPLRRHSAEGSNANESRGTSPGVLVAEDLARESAPTVVEEVGDVHATQPAIETCEESTPEKTHSGYFTPYAGLFLVVAILARLRLAVFLAARPEHLESGFPMRLLWSIGSRVGLNTDDPLATALESGSLFDARRDVIADDPARDLHAMWLSAVRGWCKRQLRTGLKQLICRPGRVHITETHVEVTFELAQLDTRVRRVALDVDPGWVPWLGRVVMFHYTDSAGRHE
jgi:hypothetical protein